MKTKLMVLVSVIALLLCGVVTMTYAQGPGPEGKAFAGGRGHGWGMGLWSGELNLTDAQKAQIKTILQENRTAMKSTALQMEKNRAALLAATAQGAYDQPTVQNLAAQQAQLQATMTANREAIKHKIYTQVLTADQQAKVEQLRAQQMNRINEHLQRMGNGTDVPPPPAQQ